MGSYGLMHVSTEPDATAYGTIARTGKSWSIKLRDKRTTTGGTISGSIDGYGEFPFEKYWGLPVIDFSGESFDRCFEGLKIMDCLHPAIDIRDLDKFIKAYQMAGFKVHLNGYESPIIDADQDQRDQLTDKMPEYRSEHERALWGVALAGSSFKKVYYDPSLERQVSFYVPAEDIILPYGVTNIRRADRLTHIMRKTKNELRKLQVSIFTGMLISEILRQPRPTSRKLKQKKKVLML